MTPHIRRNLRNNKKYLGTKNSFKRYPRRSVPLINYTENIVIPKDHYTYCTICSKEYLHKCTTHLQTIIHDTPVSLVPQNLNRAQETLPKEWLRISSSKIVNGGKGVWTIKQIKIGTRFGPYEGVIKTVDPNNEYTWEIKREAGKMIKFLDGGDQSKSNWMRFVNCARHKSEQNVMAYQYKGNIYYKAVIDIPQGTELLVFYGSSFAKQLGIDMKKFYSTNKPELINRQFTCKFCKVAFSNPLDLEDHCINCDEKCTTSDKNNNKANGDVAPNDSINQNQENELKCTICGLKFSNIQKFENHSNYCKTMTYNGLINNSNVGNNDNQNSNKDLPRKRIKCRYCKYVIKNEEEFNNHFLRCTKIQLHHIFMHQNIPIRKIINTKNLNT